MCVFARHRPQDVATHASTTTPCTFPSYDTFISSYFLPLEIAAARGSSMRSFDSPPCLLLSNSTIHQNPQRLLVLLRNGNLMSTYSQVNDRRLWRKYFRLSFPEDASSPAYRGRTVASSANSDLLRLLCHFSEQLVDMRCSPLPPSMEVLGDSVSAVFCRVTFFARMHCSMSLDALQTLVFYASVAE